MSFEGTAFIPDNNCPCEEAEVCWRKHHGQWAAVIVSCPKNCELPQMKPEPDVHSNFGVERATR